MESDDEDVVFENSVLHQALLDCGITDLETEPRNIGGQVQEIISDCLKDDNGLSYVTFKKEKTCFNSLVYLFCSSEELLLWHTHHRYQTLTRLINSPLLAEEDKSFLQYFVEDVEPCSGFTYRKRFFSLPLIGILLLIIISVNLLEFPLLLSPWINLFLSFFFPSICLHSYSVCFSVISVNALVLIIYSVTMLAVVSSIKTKILSQLKNKDEIIKKLEIISWELIYLENKCLRLLQESELIARGFTFTTNHHVASRIRRDFTEITDQMCPQLRQVMLTENIALMAEFKKQVVKMMRNLPMICNDSNYGTLEGLTLDQESHGTLESNGLENVVTKEEEKSDTTNHEAVINSDGHNDHLPKEIIPLAKLSKSVGILHIYISGLFRRLALCFYIPNFKDKSIDPYTATAECVENSFKAVQKAKSALNQSHTFYRAVHLSNSDKSGSKMDRPKPNSELRIIYAHLNNLDLQLASLARRIRGLVIAIEIRIEAETKSSLNLAGATAASDTPTDSDAIDGALQQVKETLDNCKACYEEAVLQLQRRSQLEAHQTPPRPVLSETTPTKCDVRVVPHVDHIIQDEVFEATTSAEDEDLVDNPRRRAYSEESRAKVTSQKENIKRLKQELDSVVKKIGVTHRQREARALARSRGIFDEVPPVTRLDLTASVNLTQAFSEQEKAEIRARGWALEGGVCATGDGLSPSSDEPDMPRRPLPVPFPNLDDLDEEPPLQMKFSFKPIQKPFQGNEGSFTNTSYFPSSLNPDIHALGFKPAGSFYDVDLSSQSSNETQPKSTTSTSESPDEEPVVKETPKKSGPLKKQKTPRKHPRPEARRLEFDLAKNDVPRLDKDHWAVCKAVLNIPADASSSSSGPSTHSSSPSVGVQSRDSDDLTGHLDMSGEFNPVIGVPVGSVSSKLSEEDGGGPLQSSSSSGGLMSSQINCPLSVDPEKEGFRKVGGSYLSRHNFTASGRETNLYHAKMDYTSSDSSTEQGDSMAAERQSTHGIRNPMTRDSPEIDSDPNEWVKISQRQVTTAHGSKIDIIRQKTVHVGAAQGPAVSSSDSESSFSKSIALLAAERAKGMDIPGQQEEKFGESSDEDTLY